MNPNLYEGDRVLVNTSSFMAIERGDIVVFEHKGNVYVKRCLAVPGDTVEIRRGVAYVNNMRSNYGHISGSELSRYPKTTFEENVFKTYSMNWNLLDFGPFAIPLSVNASAPNIPNGKSQVRSALGNIEYKNAKIDGIKEQGGIISNYRGQDLFFVMGDNLLHSTDSREIGLISQSMIIGKSIYIMNFGNR